MERAVHVSLTDTLDRYVREKIASGLYNNASELVREALREKNRADESRQVQLEASRRELDPAWEAADRGEFVALDPDAINRTLDAELHG